MDDYAGRVLADRYRLPAAVDAEPIQTRAFDTYSGQDVRIRQVPLPEVVEAELVEDGAGGRGAPGRGRGPGGGGAESVVQRAMQAARAAAAIPDHPRLDQVFDVFEEDGSLWIVSELVPARTLAGLLAERPLSPYRGAEVAADILTALRALHAHGWTHRNITPRTVLVCDDGRVVLTGLASGAAEEALCGYDPLPPPPGRNEPPRPTGSPGPPPDSGPQDRGVTAPAPTPVAGPAAGELEEARVPRLPDPATGFLPARAPEGRRGGPLAQGALPPDRSEGRAAIAAARAADRDPDTTPLTPYREGPPPGGQGPAHGHGGGGAGPHPGEGAERPYGDGERPPGARRPYPDAGERPGGAGPYGDGGPHRGGHGGPYGGAQAPAAHGADPSWPDKHLRGGAPPPQRQPGPAPGEGASVPARRAPKDGPSARAGVMAAYQAGTRAAAARLAGRPQHPGGPQLGAGPQHPGAPQRANGPQHPGGYQYSDRIQLPADRSGESRSQDPASGHPQGTPPQHAPYGVPPGLPPQGSAPDTTPGEATYGGSLPGVRPGASIAVPVGKHPEPAPPSALERPPQDALPAASVVHGAEGNGRYGGPTTQLAAERARQTRMQVVGPVTERWAPEQAGPIHEHWQLAPPVGPASDLWALGALLFRAVQGHPAYPEEEVGELVQLVCSEPPALAEECGALRPVVESLLRQDPTERPDFEELRGWLRSLIRTAPEPGIGSRTVTVPPLSAGRPTDPRRLPILRRRGELMRRRRAQAPVLAHGRHKRSRGRRGPRSLGRMLVALVFMAMVGAIAYAATLMPKADQNTGEQRRSALGGEREQRSSQQPAPPADDDDRGDAKEPAGNDTEPKESDGSGGGANDTGAEVPEGFELRQDPAGFSIAVPAGWERRAENDRGQVRYVGGDFELVVSAGRDSVGDYGSDPMVYQTEHEPELAAYRESAWTSASGLRRIDVGQRAMAEGEFSWSDSSGRQVQARNLAMILDDGYHVVLLIGPVGEGKAIENYHRAAVESYRPAG